MESLEAIMENENNSNLESESYQRNRHNQLTTHNFTDGDSVDLVESQGVEATEEERDVLDSDPGLINEETPNTVRPVSNEDADQDLGSSTFDISQQVDIGSVSASFSDIREENVLNYDNFIGDDTDSQNDVYLQPVGDNTNGENSANSSELCNETSLELRPVQREQQDGNLDDVLPRGSEENLLDLKTQSCVSLDVLSGQDFSPDPQDSSFKNDECDIEETSVKVAQKQFSHSNNDNYMDFLVGDEPASLIPDYKELCGRVQPDVTINNNIQSLCDTGREIRSDTVDYVFPDDQPLDRRSIEVDNVVPLNDKSCESDFNVSKADLSDDEFVSVDANKQSLKNSFPVCRSPDSPNIKLKNLPEDVRSNSISVNLLSDQDQPIVNYDLTDVPGSEKDNLTCLPNNLETSLPMQVREGTEEAVAAVDTAGSLVPVGLEQIVSDQSPADQYISSSLEESMEVDHCDNQSQSKSQRSGGEIPENHKEMDVGSQHPTSDSVGASIEDDELTVTNKPEDNLYGAEPPESVVKSSVEKFTDMSSIFATEKSNNNSENIEMVDNSLLLSDESDKKELTTQDNIKPSHHESIESNLAESKVSGLTLSPNKGSFDSSDTLSMPGVLLDHVDKNSGSTTEEDEDIPSRLIPDKNVSTSVKSTNDKEDTASLENISTSISQNAPQNAKSEKLENSISRVKRGRTRKTALQSQVNKISGLNDGGKSDFSGVQKRMARKEIGVAGAPARNMAASRSNMEKLSAYKGRTSSGRVNLANSVEGDVMVNAMEPPHQNSSKSQKLNVAASKQQQQLLKGRKENSSVVGIEEGVVTESSQSKSSKSKVQTCLVCQKICKCKYNIVRNGDVKHLCEDACFKQFRKNPGLFLKNPDNVRPAKKQPTKNAGKAAQGPDMLSLYQQEVASKKSLEYRACVVCQLLNLNTTQPFCNWKGLDFCSEVCLGKFQSNLSTACSFCHAYIPADLRPGSCLKIGNDMRLFCRQRCTNEFKKKLRLCALCQRDVAGVPGAFTAMIGKEGKFREFCSQACMRKLEKDTNDLEVVNVERGGGLESGAGSCYVCRQKRQYKYSVLYKGQRSQLCSELCLNAFKHANKISTQICDACGSNCSTEEAQAHFLQLAGSTKHFCSDTCTALYRKTNSKVVLCSLCGNRMLNFDMVERQDVDKNLQNFCGLACFSQYRVQVKDKTGQALPCDQCQKVMLPQYHLTMSDTTVRNFCCYACVIAFQSSFALKHGSPGSKGKIATPLSQPHSQPQPHPQPQPQLQPLLPKPKQEQQPTPTSARGRGRGRGRPPKSANQKKAESVPVISNVMSLASPAAGNLPQPAQPGRQATPPVSPSVPALQVKTSTSTATSTSNLVPSADGKHQILIQEPPPVAGKNKSLQCRPVTLTKATSCKPHCQSRETQTDDVAPQIKMVVVPVPVPVYVPMPTVMFSAPAPRLMPVPIPIPVPVFIPTTRKSVPGIFKTIQDILERVPSDPLEAELLMMAEAVAADKRPLDTDSDSEEEAGVDDFVPVSCLGSEVVTSKTTLAREVEPVGMKKREGGGGGGDEDMIQMALRMAEEMSGPIEDLETSVEAMPVNSEVPPSHHHLQTMQSYDDEGEEEYIVARPHQQLQRGAKRASRGRPAAPRVKKPRLDKTYPEEGAVQADIPVHSGPPLDANYRLKFTYGVNAWRHWVLAKNVQIEKTRQQSGSFRLRTFPTDILKCTTDELNYSLCMFIKEVRKPDGGVYSPDSIYYLCLGIQQYLYENGRIDNIFTDSYFEQFTDCLNEILKSLRPKINGQGQMLCRIEEEHLWESKQLGAHSPFILLNTLIYFHTKHFILKTAQEHMSLSFTQILKHWKKGQGPPTKGPPPPNPKNVSLRYYCLANGKKDGSARRNKDGGSVFEVTENIDNPLRCPVKLYEFFLSKCPESIKNRNDIFYPVPERSCVPDSPVWYSTQSIDICTMDKMLTRVLLVREIQESHLHAQSMYM